MAKKIFNTIKTAILCGYAYWKNPENFTNEGFKFMGDVMKAINRAADEKINFINQVATVHKDTGKELVKMFIWVGVYDCETAQDNPFDRITHLLSRRDEVVLMYEAERDRLKKVLKPYYESQHYAKAKEYQDQLNRVNEFILHLKRIK
jgi:hypothetical protein